MARRRDRRRAVVADTVRSLGSTVRRLRVEAGLSQRELAERAGVDEEDVRRLESGPGGSELGYATLNAIARELGVAPPTLAAQSEARTTVRGRGCRVARLFRA
jgi:transcriptional regulator with XRE-family HTH domain